MPVTFKKKHPHPP